MQDFLYQPGLQGRALLEDIGAAPGARSFGPRAGVRGGLRSSERSAGLLGAF